MNLRLSKNDIRIRLSQNDFNKLQKLNQLDYEFSYWPIKISLIKTLTSKIGHLQNNHLMIFITPDELGSLNLVDSQKSGLDFIITNAKEINFSINLQLDLGTNR